MSDDLLKAIFFRSSHDPALAHRLHVFRKKLFVDELGWDLTVSGDAERDQFDLMDPMNCALFVGDELVGTFRALRCDRAYLGKDVFPQLAWTSPYPTSSECWEISRLGMTRTRRRHAKALYAAMFAFGWMRGAAALVAIADLEYERFLHILGIATRRYGPPQEIGRDLRGRPIVAVAGEIPLRDQPPALVAKMHALLDTMEITDETLVLGSRRVPA